MNLVNVVSQMTLFVGALVLDKAAFMNRECLPHRHRELVKADEILHVIGTSLRLNQPTLEEPRPALVQRQHRHQTLATRRVEISLALVVH